MRGGAVVAALMLIVAGCSDDEPGESTAASVRVGTSVGPTESVGPTASSIEQTVADSTVGPTEPPTTAAAPSSVPAEPWFTPTLGERACPAGYPVNAECSMFTVAADRADPDSGTVQLPVVVLRATGPRPVPDALVIPAGGPGYPGANNIGWVDSPFIRRRDIVLYDQRGTGDAVPSLDCPGVDQAFVAALQAKRPYRQERNTIATAQAECVAALERGGVDLTDYHSEASAADLDELRHAHGYEQWNVLGISYGGRLALATMRSFPDGIRAVILDSVYDVTYGGLASTQGNIERSFRRLAEGCAADAACAEAHGDLNVTYERVRRRYNAEPVVVDVDIGDGAGTRRYAITGDDMIAGLFNALYDATLIPLLPSILDDLLAGETGIVAALVQRGVPFATGAADGMAFAVNCADNSGLARTADDATVYDNPGRISLVAAATGVCPADWPATPGEFNTPVSSEIPSLVLAGSYDPITPPEGTAAVAEHLPNSTFILVEPVGHGVTGYDSCVERIQVAFLDHPAAPVDASCATAIPPPAFQ